VFIPIYDYNPLRSIRFQFVTIGLIAANIVVFVLEVAAMSTQAIVGFAIVPTELLSAAGSIRSVPIDGTAVAIPERLTPLSYMFFHGDIFHLGANMLFLWVFGDNVEDALGHLRYFFFYIACGVISGLTHALMLPSSELPLIGASGAVAGVIAAYLMLHPRVRVWVLVFRFIPVRISAALALGAWVLTQLVMVMLPQVGPIAWWAHVGGLGAGAVLVVLLRRPGVRLFDRELA
jgi:membrane associated rhomboid family serine protease